MDTNASATIGKNENAEYCCNLLSYVAAVFFRINVDVIIVFNFVLYITCSCVLENDYILKSFVALKWNIRKTPLANAQLIYMHKFLCILTLP